MTRQTGRIQEADARQAVLVPFPKEPPLPGVVWQMCFKGGYREWDRLRFEWPGGVGESLEQAAQLVEAEVLSCIETFYNQQRLHSTLGYVSPDAFEAQHQANSTVH